MLRERQLRLYKMWRALLTQSMVAGDYTEASVGQDAGAAEEKAGAGEDADADGYQDDAGDSDVDQSR